MTQRMIQVPKDQFYAMIGPLERIDTGATMHHHPEKMMRWRVRQWIGGEYQEVAAIETMLDRPYPHPEHHYVAERLIEAFVTF